MYMYSYIIKLEGKGNLFNNVMFINIPCRYKYSMQHLPYSESIPPPCLNMDLHPSLIPLVVVH